MVQPSGRSRTGPGTSSVPWPPRNRKPVNVPAWPIDLSTKLCRCSGSAAGAEFLGRLGRCVSGRLDSLEAAARDYPPLVQGPRVQMR